MDGSTANHYHLNRYVNHSSPPDKNKRRKSHRHTGIGRNVTHDFDNKTNAMSGERIFWHAERVLHCTHVMSPSINLPNPVHYMPICWVRCQESW